MGAAEFRNFIKGTDAKAAFNTAVSNARHEYGHGGYTGTIAEKHEFILRKKEPMTKAEARAFLTEDEMEENNKWGPAFAVAICSDDRKEILGYVFYGLASE